jgi:hypothetical protein
MLQNETYLHKRVKYDVSECSILLQKYIFFVYVGIFSKFVPSMMLLEYWLAKEVEERGRVEQYIVYVTSILWSTNGSSFFWHIYWQNELPLVLQLYAN